MKRPKERRPNDVITLVVMPAGRYRAPMFYYFSDIDLSLPGVAINTYRL